MSHKYIVITFRYDETEKQLIQSVLTGWDRTGSPIFRPLHASADERGYVSSYNLPIAYDTYGEADIAQDRAGKGLIEAVPTDWLNHIAESPAE